MLQLDTPSVLVDLDLVEENIEILMNEFRAFPHVRVRPHQKTAKSPDFAKLLIKRGAAGICVAKISEAEVFIDAGINDILITSEFVGELKIERFVKLWLRAPQVRIVIDSSLPIKHLNDALAKAKEQAKKGGTQKGSSATVQKDNGDTVHKDIKDGTRSRVDVLIDLNVGQDRTGVNNVDEAVELARAITAHENLNLIGIQGYEGHLQHLESAVRSVKCKDSMHKLVNAATVLKDAGYNIEVVTTGGTGTGNICATVDGITEVQPGSFIFSDVAYRNATDGKYKNALTVLTTVISKPTANRAVVDAGTKSLSVDMGFAEPKDKPDWSYRPAGDEYGIIESKTGSIELAVGDKLELIPGHIDTTVALHDEFNVLRKGKIEAVWPIAARGKVK